MIAAGLIVVALLADPADAESRARDQRRAAIAVGLALGAVALAWRYAHRPLKYGRGPFRCYGLALGSDSRPFVPYVVCA